MEFSVKFPKPLPPLKKGGREGFPGRSLQSGKGLQVFSSRNMERKKCYGNFFYGV